jgi:hypothetical protein
MIRKPSSTALRALVCAILFASFITVSCNDNKKESKESTTTDSIAPAPIDTTKTVDTGTGHPVVPGNRTDTISAN